MTVRTLDEILAELQRYKHPLPHKLDALVVAYMVMEMQKSAKTHFSVDDAKRYLFRIYTAPNSAQRLIGDTRIGGDDGQNLYAYLSKIKRLVKAAKTDKNGLTDTDIENLIVTKRGYSLHEKGGNHVEFLARCIKGDATEIFAYLLARSPKRLLYLDRSRKQKVTRSGMHSATSYALVLRNEELRK